MTTLDKIKEIEDNINYLLDTYDKALENGDDDIAHKTVDCIEYELEKLRSFGTIDDDIVISTEITQ